MNKPIYDKPTEIKWLNGVPFGGLTNKEVYFEQTMEYDMVYKNKDRICEMCGEPLYDDTDYCEECKDHTSALITCPECNGEGWIEVIDHLKVNSATIDIPYKKIQCENCEEGWVQE